MRNKVTIMFLTVLCAIIFSVGLFCINNFTGTTNKPTESSLKSFYNKISELDNDKNYGELYQYELPTLHNFLTKERYVEYFNRIAPKTTPISTDYKINGVEVLGNIGIIDRTITTCQINPCENENKNVSRIKKTYIFSDGKWNLASLYTHAYNFSLPNAVPQYCTRNEGYTMAPEFKRSISLIQQRLTGIQNVGNSNVSSADLDDAKFISQTIDNIYNCLDIKYANNEEELQGAEGIFSFKGGSAERLSIIVNPKYSTNDDLLTAALLIHEINHAATFAYESYSASVGVPYSKDCYENEADSFTASLLFLNLLNSEEKNSILTRANNNSQAASELIQGINYIFNNSSGQSYYERALSYVKSSSYYIKQCSD